MFESRILRKIFGTKREEVGGNWRKVCNKELHGSFSSPAIVKDDEMTRDCGTWRGRREMPAEF